MNAFELKVPPVALVLVFAAAMWLASAEAPSLALAVPWRIPISIAIAAAGIIFVIAGVLAFRKAKTTVNPTTPGATVSVVASGVYRVSRNPMYVGFLLALVGWATFLAHALAFLLLPAFVAYMSRFQIAPEERILSAKFGSSYVAYMHSVRRWL